MLGVLISVTSKENIQLNRKVTEENVKANAVTWSVC